MEPIFAFSRNHKHVGSPFCGDLVEVLRGGGTAHTAPDIAILVDVTSTRAHFHRGFDEAYFVLDGSMTVRLFNPADGTETERLLGEHEVCVIPRDVHHKITCASYHNRLCVLSMPSFDGNDEVPSDRF
jgi:mannose-6-phosphate isomerase-like protein (cupin superfamily)